MKKIVSTALIFIIIFTCIIDVCSKSPYMSLIYNSFDLLEEKYKGIETDNGYMVLDFDTHWEEDTFIISAECNYYISDQKMFENYTDEDKQNVIDEMLYFMIELITNTMGLIPDIKFGGYYKVDFINIFYKECLSKFYG